MRILGIDDGPFRKEWVSTLLAGVLHDNYKPLRAVFAPVKVDGDDATEAAVSLARKTNPELIVVDSVTCCGFNYIDGERVYNETGIPVIHVYLYPLDLASIRSALEKAGLPLDRLYVIRKHWLAASRVECRLGGFWYNSWGSTPIDPCTLQRYSRIPLHLQNAHRVARAAVEAWKRYHPEKCLAGGARA